MRIPTKKLLTPYIDLLNYMLKYKIPQIVTLTLDKVVPPYWHNPYTNEKSSDNHRLSELFSLDYQDSNLDKQNQNLLCYHYTIVQTYVLSVKKRCKDRTMSRNMQIFRDIFSYQHLILQ